jgi:uncharacterized protein
MRHKPWRVSCVPEQDNRAKSGYDRPEFKVDHWGTYVKLDHLDESKNVEDRRGGRRGGLARGGQIGGLGLIVVVIAALLFGVDPRQLLGPQGLQQPGASTGDPAQPYQESQAEAVLRERSGKVLRSTEIVWTEYFQSNGQQYPAPGLVLYSGSDQSACGAAQAGMGPFYCPADQKIYIDLSFFAELSQRFGAPGDFAQAYVIAHEVGHHIQTILGISGKVNQARMRMSPAEGNQMSVRLELQADCIAGVWARREDANNRSLEPGDIQEALGAAAAVGDDRLQKKATGAINPEGFTHGTAEQRARWFKTGFDAGSIDACDTFSREP